jgi:hypothetical protein
MATPVSGEISILDLSTEFGGAGEEPLSDYYDADEGVPENGILRLSDFYNKSVNTKVIVTEGSGSGVNTNYWGWADRSPYAFGPGAFGSSDTAQFLGVDIVMLAHSFFTLGPQYRFEVVLQGLGRAQNFFNGVLFEDGNKLLTSAATFHGDGIDDTFWAWNVSQVTRWDGSGSSFVRLYD